LLHRITKERLSSHVLSSANDLIAHCRRHQTETYPNELSKIIYQPDWSATFEALDELPEGFEEFTEREKQQWALSHDLSPEYRDALEHWCVSPWLFRQLETKGEMVAEILGFHIWGRPTSGQSVYLDSVMQEIASELAPTQAEARHDL
jgi:hypothetical protein